MPSETSEIRNLVKNEKMNRNALNTGNFANNGYNP